MKTNWNWMAGLALAAVVGLGAGWKLGRSGGPLPAAPQAGPGEGEGAAQSVSLPEAKSQAAQIETTAVARRTMRAARWVPGRVQYDDTRHVEQKAGTDGVLVKVLVKPGDQVREGQVLAVLSSPEVGTARADVLQKLAEQELARRTHTWKQETGEQVAKMIAAIDDS
ncbi:MAG: efflux RND transporter periplasmic adaptor subunit, partial [Planctomycetaceae bacterium]